MNSNQVNWSHYNHSGRALEISISQKLALYGSSALSGIEHLRLLVGQDSVADALVQHFGSLQALQRASFRELRQFLTARQAEGVMAGLCMSIS
jgi:DNA repair protein RadC